MPSQEGSLLHHVALGARHVERLAQFYQQALDLRRVKEQRRADGSLRSIWCALHSERGTKSVLMIEETSDPSQERPPAKVAPGWFLLAFCVTAEQREATEAAIVEAGGTIESRSAYSTYARDLENNRFAVSCYPFED